MKTHLPPQSDNQTTIPVTAYELSSIATTLSLLNPQKSGRAPETYFPQAFQLIQAAAKFLCRQNPSPDEIPAHLKWAKSFTFAEIIKERSPAKSGKKKPTTMLGTIGTLPGLHKAIRRVFGAKSPAIITRGSLYQYELDLLEDDQRKINEAKTKNARSSQ